MRGWAPGDHALRRCVSLVHGFGEHSARYDHLGEWFAERGTAVYALDLVGHGRSGGARNYVRRFADFLDDVDVFLAHTRGLHSDVRRVLMGHSMGALISAAHATERAPDVAQLVLSAPPFATRLPGLQRLAARALRPFLPRLRLGSGIAAEALAHDEDVVRRYVEDPLVDTRITLSLAVEMFAQIDRTKFAGDRVPVPCFVLHGASDRIAPSEGAARFHSGMTVPGSDLRIYPKLRHEIFNEPEKYEIFAELLAWMDGADAGAKLRAMKAR